ncbi:MAG: hypothetical protein ACRDOK_18685 [Streptosporangiaceae bacterium]
MTSPSTARSPRLRALPAPGRAAAPVPVISPAVAARIRQLAAQAEHRRNIADFHARHLADQQARINALLQEAIATLAGLLTAPASAPPPGTGPRGRDRPHRD